MSEREFFYRPAGAWAADFIPFHHDGRFRLFYLLDWRDKAGHGEGTPWYQISTTDFVHFEEHGEMVGRGTVEEQDLYIFTGCVIEWEGAFHLFYTGHNPHFRAAGKPEQAVMHAVSDDLLHWRKIPEDTFYAPPDRFEPHDWRDPFVFRHPDTGEWWMLLAARLKEGPSRRRGCTALCVSNDLKTWEVRDPLWAPGLYFTHECPDLFRMGEWWYLIFSEFSEGHNVRYRMARSPEGPWQRPPDDTLDGRAWYAAKTASDGQQRYAFGWNATRVDDSDTGKWQWGGNLAVREVTQQPDGSLALRPPSTVVEAFGTAAKPHPGRLQSEGFAFQDHGAMPRRARVEAILNLETGTRAAGLWLRGSEDGESGYTLRYEPDRARLVFDRWPRPGDQPFAAELERPLRLEPGETLRLTVLVDGSVCEIYANDREAMSCRLYDHPEGHWGCFVTEGAVTISWE